jgi:hypothetical protein
MKCWGCNGYHLYRDCPLRVEKVKVFHNVHQAKTIEDMGRNVPRIYATLDNKKAEFESHMVEIEGKINNKHISILID